MYGIIGSLFGNFFEAQAYPLWGAMSYTVLDVLFFFVIAISFFIYYKLYQYSKVASGIKEEVRDTLKYLVITLTVLNLIFVGIILEFIYVRQILVLFLPMATRIIWLVLAMIAFCLILKSYERLCMSCQKKTKKKK